MHRDISQEDSLQFNGYLIHSINLFFAVSILFCKTSLGFLKELYKSKLLLFIKYWTLFKVMKKTFTFDEISTSWLAYLFFCICTFVDC